MRNGSKCVSSWLHPRWWDNSKLCFVWCLRDAWLQGVEPQLPWAANCYWCHLLRPTPWLALSVPHTSSAACCHRVTCIKILDLESQSWRTLTRQWDSETSKTRAGSHSTWRAEGIINILWWDSNGSHVSYDCVTRDLKTDFFYKKLVGIKEKTHAVF